MKKEYYFEDLLIQEIYMDYKQNIIDKMTNEKATEKTLEDYSEIFDENTPQSRLAMIALAYYQWSIGRLLPIIKEKARFTYRDFMDYIDEYYEMDITGNYVNTLYKPDITHQKVIDQVETIMQLLDTEMPKIKRLISYREYEIKGLEINGIYAYKIPCEAVEEQTADACYMYFYFLKDVLPPSRDKYIYIYNIYSVGRVLTLDEVQNVGFIPSCFHYRQNLHQKKQVFEERTSNVFLEFVHPKHYKWQFVWNMNTFQAKKGNQKSIYLGQAQKILLPVYEADRMKEPRNSFSPALFETLELSITTRAKGYKNCDIPHFINGKILFDPEVEVYEEIIVEEIPII
ncbi:MAG: hypothetical protein KKH01_05010 [Firmicutes bacterium]|nr:hypothetical protein [Bacillota bacterium]